MRIDRHFLRRAKAFLIEFTASVSLLLVLVKIIITEAHQLFREQQKKELKWLILSLFRCPIRE